jgi:hypothetical protein
LNSVAGIQKEMEQTIVSTYANELLLVGIFYFIKMAKEIQLTQGKVAIVDNDDYERILSYGKWTYHKNGYAIIQKGFKNEFGSWCVKVIRMHRIVLNAQDGQFVDHSNEDKLDNRKTNIRICTQIENKRNVGIRKNNKSGFKGVFFWKDRNKFTSQIWFEKKKIHLGVFINPIDAARAYNDAALKYHGEFANINKID